jgi:hypothetical protein
VCNFRRSRSCHLPSRPSPFSLSLSPPPCTRRDERRRKERPLSFPSFVTKKHKRTKEGGSHCTQRQGSCTKALLVGCLPAGPVPSVWRGFGFPRIPFQSLLLLPSCFFPCSYPSFAFLAPADASKSRGFRFPRSPVDSLEREGKRGLSVRTAPGSGLFGFGREVWCGWISTVLLGFLLPARPLKPAPLSSPLPLSASVSRPSRLQIGAAPARSSIGGAGGPKVAPNLAAGAAGSI